MRIYTDGSCKENPGRGGWAWAVDEEHWGLGCARRTTNQRMELTAALEAIRANPQEGLTIVTDSAYVMNCFIFRWYEKWTWDGFKLKDGMPVMNWDLWLPLMTAVEEYEVAFEKVKGHSGDRMNDFVDRLARQASGVEEKKPTRFGM